MKKNITTEGFWLITADLLFALFLFLYLFYAIDMAVIYQGGGAIITSPIFFQGMETFNKVLFVPGGLVKYASSLLSQFFYFNWVGSLIVAMLGFVMCRQLLYIIKKTGSGFKFLRFTGPIVLLCLYLRYTFFFDEQLALVATLFFMCFYLRFSNVVGLRKILLIAFSTIASYWFCQGGGVVFALTVAVYELLINRSFRDSLILLLAGLLLPYVLSTIILNENILIAYSGLLGFTPHTYTFEPRPLTLVPLYILFALPVALTLVGFMRGFFRKINPDFTAGMRLKIAGFIVGNLIVVIAATGFCFGYHDKMMNAVFRTDYYTVKRDWKSLVSLVDKYTASPKSDFLGYPGNNYVIASTNLALFKLNRLGYDLFCYPQNPRTLFLSMQSRFAFSRRVDIYMDMGLLNIAEHQLLESLEVIGETPAFYQRLALIYMAKNNIPNAVVYLKRLKRLFFYKKWAQGYLDVIETNQSLGSLSDIRYLRSMMLDESENDAYAPFYLEKNPVITEEMIIKLLKKKPTNRMAFEYLLSFYLLTDNLEKFTKTFDKYIGNYKYKSLPPLWQQAIISYCSILPDRDQKIKKYPVSQEQFIIYQRFITTISKYKKRESAVWELAKSFGRTYFFYHIYHFSGVK